MKRSLLLLTLVVTVLLADPVGKVAKNRAKDGAKSVVTKDDDRSAVKKKKKKVEREAKKTVIKTVL